MTESCTGKYYTKITGEGWICNYCGYVNHSRMRVQIHALKCEKQRNIKGEIENEKYN